MNKPTIIFLSLSLISAIAAYRYRQFLRTHKQIRLFLKEFVLPVFLFVFFIPGMIGRITYVPSGSMTPTIIKGDKIVLSKIHFGPRTPSTIFQLPFFDKKYYKGIQVPSVQLPGFSSIKLGDCVVFNFPEEIKDNYDMRQWFVKRIVGMPGQKFKIEAGQIYIHGEPLQLPEHVALQHRYLITLQPLRYASKERKYLESRLHTKTETTNLKHTYIACITEKQATQLKQHKEVKKIEKYVQPLQNKKREKRYFTYGKHFATCLGGNIDQMPEVTIPAQGMSIKINAKNLYIYGHVILHHEGLENVKIDPEKGTLTIHGEQQETYTFQQNYYSAMGDNRHDSRDFRSWGFLPESHIVGKPVLILFSNKNDYFLADLFTLQLNWNRFFKAIR